MLSMLREELDKQNALTPQLNDITQLVVNSIPYTTVHEHMKATVAIAQITNFAAQFKRNIMLPDDTLVPINAIAFVVKGSGYGGDSSVKSARKCFKPGFEMIEAERLKITKAAAIKAATDAGEEPANEYGIYKEYLKPIPPIDIMVTTEPGFIQHVNDIGELGISSGFLYSGEFSDELAYNPDMVSNIKVLSEIYDLGDKEAKYTKGVEFRSNAITGQPVSALFVGSPGHILYDENTKKKFHVAFMSKLARRSWFCYAPERITEQQFDNVNDMLDYEENIERKAKEARASMADLVRHITAFGLATLEKPIEISKEAYKLFQIYKRYNSELVDASSNQDSTSALIRRHLQWKALKLSGAFALMDQSDIITADHYIQAMNFAEILDKDMEIFEYDLNKAPHERFSDYIKTLVTSENKATISIHDIKKHGFATNVSRNKLQELVKLCAGYDTSGIYSIVNEDSAVQYESIIKTTVLGLSYKPIDTTALNKAVTSGDKDAIDQAKRKISATTAYGFEVENDISFADLGELLENDFAYSPFVFRNGVRGKDNIIGGTKWLVLDVDDSPTTASEAHFMLSGINHHVALSSDPDNEYKFRVLIELDSPVTLDAQAWKYFYSEIASDLALKVDLLPQSQIFFSYADRPVMSETDSEPLEVRNYVMLAKERVNEKDHKESRLTTKQARSLLDDPLETFYYAFNAEDGSGSRNLIRAAYHAKDLGASAEDTIQLISDINDYWMSPMPDERLDKILQQIERMY